MKEVIFPNMFSKKYSKEDVDFVMKAGDICL